MIWVRTNFASVNTGAGWLLLPAFTSLIPPAVLSKIGLDSTALPVPVSTTTPVPVLSAMVLPAPAVVAPIELFDPVMSTPTPLGTAPVPAAFVPTKFPSIRFVEPAMLIP